MAATAAAKVAEVREITRYDWLKQILAWRRIDEWHLEANYLFGLGVVIRLLGWLKNSYFGNIPQNGGESPNSLK